MTRTLYIVMTTDGTAHRGEYIGAQDGFMYLSDGDEVARIDQKHITGVAMKQVPGE